MECLKHCCKLHIEPYIEPPHLSFKHRNKKKAGVFIYDSDKNSILIVQSRGNLWGFPKGTFEKGEDSKTCALRELQEETGIILNSVDESAVICLYGSAYYYFVNMKETDVYVQNNMIIKNDVNGIGWIRIECLIDMIKVKKIVLNSHAKKCLFKFLNINI
jgi:ADP-ribose pyrophosphatase YjhB (NUDIX family)